jgi:hypothetical protein
MGFKHMSSYEDSDMQWLDHKAIAYQSLFVFVVKSCSRTFFEREKIDRFYIQFHFDYMDCYGKNILDIKI